tara:strand:- start:123 stop:302 length:180 start_codon:yes stop_codon:yes gene_type:complete
MKKEKIFCPWCMVKKKKRKVILAEVIHTKKAGPAQGEEGEVKMTLTCPKCGYVEVYILQ